MAMRAGRLRRRVGRTGLIALCVAALSALWIGCAPRERYQTLSFFFDGVPNPSDALAKTAAVSSGSAQVHPGKAALAHQHKPFADGNCAACHQPDKKIDVAHVKQGCLSCHKNVETQYAAMHAPVATGECLWCHLPHESNEPMLLSAPSPKLCRQCHDSAMLFPNPPEHMDQQRNCLDCHLGHGGSTGQHLKPGIMSTTLPTRGGAS